ncbi:MAG: GTPase [Promethearchaeota archaeon]
MPIGLALITSILDPESLRYRGILASSFPKDFTLSRGLIHKIINSMNSPEKIKSEIGNENSENSDGFEGLEDETFELKYNDKIILLNCRTFPATHEKEFIVIILSPDEVPNSNAFYETMLENTPQFYKFPKHDRIKKFVDFTKKFFPKSDGRKLLIIGFPSAGKTCIKKAFFDGTNPEELLGEKSPEATRGLAHFVYSWLDTEVGIVDSSGQEFDSYVSVNDSYERTIAFEESDIVIYVFDVVNWSNEREKVIENLEKIIYTKNSLSGRAQIYAFCHKIDLLEGSNQEKAKMFLKIKDSLEKRFGIKTIFTSIQPELIHTLFRSMQIILNEFSKLGGCIEGFCNDVIKGQQKSAVFLLNKKNQVISQKSTSDIKLEDVNTVIELAKNQRSLLLGSPEFGNLDYSVVHTSTNMALIVKNVNILKYGVSAVAFLSHNVTRETLSDILTKLDQRLCFESRAEHVI